MVIPESYCAGLLFGVRSAALKVNDMSEKKVEYTYQKCADVLVWVSFFSSTQTGVLKKVLRTASRFYISRGASRTSMGSVRARTERREVDGREKSG